MVAVAEGGLHQSGLAELSTDSNNGKSNKMIACVSSVLDTVTGSSSSESVGQGSGCGASAYLGLHIRLRLVSEQELDNILVPRERGKHERGLTVLKTRGKSKTP